MARFGRIRTALRGIIIAGVASTALASTGCPMCPDSDEYTTERFIELREPIPKWEALIDQCRDEGACDALCQQVIRDIEGGDWDRWLLACELLEDNGSEVLHLQWDQGVACGRRPPNLAPSVAGRTDNPVGAYFAETTRLEAAAIDAFVHIGRELEAHGAPPYLIDQARRAARDEVRHTTLTARLSRRYGTTPRTAHCSPAPIRSLFELAMDNASEGCVRETYGAVVALWQSQTAADPAVRAAMTPIAADESGHAALSLRIDEWIDGKLDKHQRSHVDEAKRDAARNLGRALATAPAPALVSVAGLPSAADAQRLLDATLATVGVAQAS